MRVEVDPVTTGIRPKDANWSPLMRALNAGGQKGQVVNWCKKVFEEQGCQDHELDDQGYCRHLVGFTNDGQTLEPLTQDENLRGRRKVIGDKNAIKRLDLPNRVLKTDHLERITTTYRVYRDVGPKPSEMTDEELDEATKPVAAV